MSFSAIWTRRLKYMLSPQFDLYKRLADSIFGDRSPNDPPLKTLDYGCGTGFGAIQFQSILEDKVVGVDSDLDVTEFASEVFGSLVSIAQADALADNGDPLRAAWEKLVKSEESFDVVLLIEVIEHLENYSQSSLIEELRVAVENENGMLVLSTPNKRSQFRKHEGHIGVHDPASMRALVAPYFADVAIEDYLGEPVADDTTVSPLVAVCRGPR
jgi:2-polyprenyl-3-methyl-5-hydroxy-6-metoxy-1,4-benzoquinol methylase